MSNPDWFAALVVGLLTGSVGLLLSIVEKLNRIIRLLEIGNDINNQHRDRR